MYDIKKSKPEKRKNETYDERLLDFTACYERNSRHNKIGDAKIQTKYWPNGCSSSVSWTPFEHIILAKPIKRK